MRPMLFAPAAAVCAAAAALVAFAPGGDAAPARQLASSVTYQDSTGEDAQGPDIVTIVVSNDNNGNLTFVINIPNRPTLTGDMLILVFVDTDANPATGNASLLGADYAIQLAALGGPAAVGLFRWNGSDFVSSGVSQTSLVFSYASGATIKISAAELGATKKFNFAALAASGLVVTPSGDLDTTNAHFDNAPDAGHGFYAYEVKLTPPTLSVRNFGTKPLAPRAGAPFTVSLVAARSDGAPIGSGTATCKAAIAGKAIKALVAGVANGRASCVWLIPKTAKGKTIRGSITLESEGLKATHGFTAKIH